MTWRVAESLGVLLGQLNAQAPARSKASDGSIGDADHASRTSDHNPWVMDGGIGVVTARDFTHDPSAGADMHRFAEVLRESKDPRIKYVIWSRRIFSGTRSPWTWRAFDGAPHTAHLHLSVQPTKALYDEERRWTLEEDDMTPEQMKELKDHTIAGIRAAVAALAFGENPDGGWLIDSGKWAARIPALDKVLVRLDALDAKIEAGGGPDLSAIAVAVADELARRAQA